ncbi:Lrp/AsnC family transcriptional regulator [Candidatus Micrarchaeota archaeon]|nr:Lrp/AsnC family transcriptional regulator [Candidatus Micrarchaeota archaeon]
MAKANQSLPPSSPKINTLDCKILRELDQDASQSLSQIGKKFKTTRDVIHYRVRRLESLGIIRKYVTLIDYSKLGFFAGSTNLKLQHSSFDLKKQLIENITSDPRVFWFSERDGRYDFEFGWFVRTIPEVKELQRELIGEYARHVRDTSFMLSAKFYQFRRKYLYKGKNDYHILEAKPERRTDKTDEEILKILGDNARMADVEIAKKVGLSAAQVHYRIKNMKENDVILGSRCSLDIGYEKYRFDIYLDDYSIHDSVITFAVQHPNAVFAYDGVGGADLALGFEVKDYKQLKLIEEEFKNQFGDEINYLEIVRSKDHKSIHLPLL